MEPITMLAIGMGVGALGKAASAGIRASQIFTEDDEERLGELERLQDLNALGLTEDETKVLTEQMLDPVAAMQAQRNLQRREIASAADLGAGAVAKQMMQEEEMAARQESDVAKNISAINLQQQKLQEQEIRDLKKRKEIENKEMLAAVVGGSAEIAQIGLTAGAKQKELKELTGQASQMSAAQQAQMRQQMQQQRYMQQFYGAQMDPFFGYYQSYYGPQSGTPINPFFPGYGYPPGGAR
jgi:hypothetical protein